jgi:hypothetical protein
MSIAISTSYLGSEAICIKHPFDCTGNFVVKRRPSTPRVELALGGIQLDPATPAIIRTLFEVLVVFARKWHLGAFVFYDTFFFWSEWIHVDSISKEKRA